MDTLRLLLAWVLTAVASAAAQDWPRYGHDGALTGRCSIPAPSRHLRWRGRIRWPAGNCLWNFSLLLANSVSRWKWPLPPISASPSSCRRARHSWTSTAAEHCGPPRNRSTSAGPKSCPASPGTSESAGITPGPIRPVCRLQLFAYDRGFDQPRCVWQSDPPEAVVFNPLNVVFDIDGDGVQEVCVAAHYRVMIFEGTTGRKETELRYHSSRPYGWFGLADVDADGQMELVTIGDFQSHIDVLEYDPSRGEAERLSVKWRRDIEQNIEERQKWPQVGPHPLADVTGDGRPELILNMFNDAGDGQWHAVVLEADTGRTLWDLPQRFVQGAADVDGDGAAELFTTVTDGELVPSCGTIELVAGPGRKPTVRQVVPERRLVRG